MVFSNSLLKLILSQIIGCYHYFLMIFLIVGVLKFITFTR